MKNWKLAFLSLAFATVALWGCATGAIYQVRINGYTASAAPAPFAPGNTFSVVENQDAKNPLLEGEIKAKISSLLEKRGYSLAPPEQADYLLKFTYGMDSPGQATVAKPSFGFGVGVGYGGWGWYPYGAYGVYWPGCYPYNLDTRPLYDRWLTVTVLEGRHYRATGKTNPVWVGEARSTGASADLRLVLNSLLIAAFDQFGKNTGKALPETVKQNDPRFRELEQLK